MASYNLAEENINQQILKQTNNTERQEDLIVQSDAGQRETKPERADPLGAGNSNLNGKTDNDHGIASCIQ